MATQELTNTTTLGTDVTYPHTNFRTVTEEELQEIITEINNQPRKHLDQATPAETHQHHTQSHHHSAATSDLKTGSDYEASNDDRVGEGNECADHVAADFGADRAFLESVVVSGVGAFHEPSGSGLYRATSPTHYTLPPHRLLP